MPPSPNASGDHQSASRRFYARTDDGDWMELRPVSERDAGSGVEVYVTSAHDDEDLFLQAQDIEGDCLGRLVVIDGRPVLLPD